jgi:hypothetical protein
MPLNIIAYAAEYFRLNRWIILLLPLNISAYGAE